MTEVMAKTVGMEFERCWWLTMESKLYGFHEVDWVVNRGFAAEFAVEDLTVVVGIFAVKGTVK